MKENNIDFVEILQIIQDELLEVMQRDINIYSKYKIVLSSEQQFENDENKDAHTIYIVVSFGQAEVTFGSAVLSMTMKVLGEKNKLNIARRLLTDFAEGNNLKRIQNGKIQQILNSPSVSSNFNIVRNGFRSLLILNGSFIISEHANNYDINYYYTGIESVKKDNIEVVNRLDVFTINGERLYLSDKEGDSSHNFSYQKENNEIVYKKDGENISETDWTGKYGLKEISVEKVSDDLVHTIQINTDNTSEKVQVLQSGFGMDANLDTQAFYYRKNFTQSEVKFGSIVFNVSTYLLDNSELLNKIVGIITKNIKTDPKGVNSTFKMGIAFKTGGELIDDFKLVSALSNQTIGEIPLISLTFTN